MKKLPTLYVVHREEWRLWLEQNYDKKKEIWLLYYKKHTGHPRIPYDDAVEEALCFGWIDSLVRRLDDYKFAQKFTPRKDVSRWSESNKRRIRKLLREGKLTKAGLDKIDPAIFRTTSAPRPKKVSRYIPRFIIQSLKANPPALDNFKALAPSYRNNYIKWITASPRKDTRTKRLKEAIRLLRQNQKLGLK